MRRPICFLFVIITASTIGFVEARSCGFQTQILPDWFAPYHYKLNLNIEMVENSFQGDLDLAVKVVDNKNRIVLHAANNLSIKETELLHAVNYRPGLTNELRPIKIRDICRDDQLELLVIEMQRKDMKDMWPGDTVIIRLKFEGSTVDNLGLVRLDLSDSLNLAGEKVVYSRFGRFWAHHLFPCMNEPRHKVVINLSLNNLQEYYDVYSNALEYNLSLMENGRRVIVFKDTAPISIHQFAFVIGRFNHKEIDLGAKRSVIAMSLNGEPELTEYSQDILKKSMRQLMTLFNITHPKTLRIFRIPNIGRSLEVNSAGIIIVDSTVINHDPSLVRYGAETTLYIASVVELLAHQWFGILVTLKHDNERWLFEGLIGWTALRVTEDLSSSVSYQLLFARNRMSAALNKDAAEDSEGLSVYARSQRIGQAFTSFHRKEIDSIRGEFELNEYQRTKAIAFVNSLQETCPNHFKSVMIPFVVSYKSKLVGLDEFLDLITMNCDWFPYEAAKYYLANRGFPLIRVRDAFPNQFIVKQEKFDPNIKRQAGRRRNVHWVVPMTYTYGQLDNSPPRRAIFRLDHENKVAAAGTFRAGSWAKFNNLFKGFYRVLYSDDLLDSMSKAAVQHLNDIDCVNLLDDALAIFKSGYKGTSYLIKTMKMLKSRNNELIRELLIISFKEIENLYPNSDMVMRNELRSFALQIFSHDLMVRESNPFDSLNLRTKQGVVGLGMIYETLALYDYQPFVDNAIRIFPSFNTEVEMDLHGAIFIVIARRGSHSDFLKLTRFYESGLASPTLSVHKAAMALALAWSDIRLHSGWLSVQKGSPDLIVDFLKNLPRTAQGEEFLIKHLHELPDFKSTLGDERFITLIRDICTQVSNIYPFLEALAPFIESELRSDIMRSRGDKNLLRQTDQDILQPVI